MYRFVECIGKLDWRLDDMYKKQKKKGDAEWPLNYAALLEYYKEHGTCNVPQDAVYECDLEGLGDDGGVHHYVGSLGSWLSNQRTARKEKDKYKKITSERKALLQKLVDEGKCICLHCHSVYPLYNRSISFHL